MWGDKMIIEKQILTALIMTFLVGTVTAQEDKGKAVAIVDGTTIYDAELISSNSIAQMADEQRQQLLEKALNAAIDQQLMHAAAVKEGLDKDPEYIAAVASQKMMMVQRKFESDANVYEQQFEALNSARDRDAVKEEDIDASYKENAAKYKGRSEERAKHIIRSQLANQKYRMVYADWLETLVGEFTVKANGSTLPASDIVTAVQQDSGRLDRSIGGLDPLWLAVTKAAGITVPDDIATAKPESLSEVRKQLLTLTITVGKSDIKLQNLYQFQALKSQSSPIRLGPELFGIIKTYIVWEKAQAEGFFETDEYKEQALVFNSRNALARNSGDPAKLLLINHFVQKQGFYNTADVTVEDAEVDAFYAEHGARYKRLENRPNGIERVRKVIERILKLQISESKKEDFLKELRAGADIDRL
jgi:hypothetical protein